MKKLMVCCVAVLLCISCVNFDNSKAGIIRVELVKLVSKNSSFDGVVEAMKSNDFIITEKDKEQGTAFRTADKWIIGGQTIRVKTGNKSKYKGAVESVMWFFDKDGKFKDVYVSLVEKQD